MSKVQQPLII